jgi:hypothetical protein
MTGEGGMLGQGHNGESKFYIEIYWRKFEKLKLKWKHPGVV